MVDTNAPPSTRVRAADSVLDHAKQAIVIEDVEVRVAALEEAAELSKIEEGTMTTINLLRRLEALEQQFTSEPIVLLMPDGRTETLPGHSDYVLDLLGRAVREDRTPKMELIAQSKSSREPGGAHMIDLARALLNGPAEDPSRQPA